MNADTVAGSNCLTPKISVIIPVYNLEKYLRQCLDSVVCQTLKEIEIICVDDGSLDGSRKILKEYEERDSRIIVMDQKNEGAGPARNMGLDAANGEYLYFLDGDDWIEPDAMETLYGRAAPDALDILKFDRFTCNDTTGERQPYVYFDGRRFPNVFSVKNVPAIYRIASSTVWNKLYRRSFIKEKNIRFMNLKTCNDIYFAFMTIALADRISVINKPFVTWRIHRAGNLTSDRGIHWKCIFAAYDKLRMDLKDRSDRITGLEESFNEQFLYYLGVEYYYATEKYEYINTAKHVLSEKCLSMFTEYISSENTVILQELTILENFLLESPEEDIKKSTVYIFERVKLNSERMQNSSAALSAVLVSRFFAVFERIKNYLGNG